MIRFCDRDVYCTAVSKCNLSDIICFMNHNKEEIVCFLDDSERFFGYVSYNGFTNELLKQTEYSEEEIYHR